MIEKPRLKTFLTVFPITETVWGVRGGPEELWRLRLDEVAVQAFCALLPYLNGQHKRNEIVEKIGTGGEDGAPALKILDCLETSGLIEDAEPHGLSGEELSHFADQLAFFSRFTCEGGSKYQSRLRASKVTVLSSGDLGHTVARQLGESGVGEVVLVWYRTPEAGRNGHSSVEGNPKEFSRLTAMAAPDGSPWPEDAEPLPNAFVFAEQAHSPAALEAMDAFSKRHRIPWLLVRSTDVHEGSVGPLFIPGETASYVSFEARLRSNMANHYEYAAFDRYVRSAEAATASAGGLRAGFELLASIAVVETVKFLTGIVPPRLAGRLLSFNIIDWESELHEVLRLPRLETPYGAEHQAFPWKEVSFAVQERRA